MKVGDKVRVIANLMDDGNAADLTGSEGVITRLYGEWALVRLDGDSWSNDFILDELEVIETAPTKEADE